MDKFIRAYFKNRCLYDYQYRFVENLVDNEQEYVERLPQENAIIYTEYRNLDKLIEEIYFSRKKYVILIESGDASIKELDYIPYNILAIYTTHIDIIDKRYKFFPFGILPTAFNAIAKTEKSIYRENKVFISFNPNTYNKRQEYLGNILKLPEDNILKHPNIYPWYLNQYYENLWRCKYVACPRGNGLDTYRFYESLHSYAIPITLPTINNLLSPFPKILTNENFEITIEDLQIQSEKINFIDNMMLQCEFWRDKMEAEFA